MLLALLHWFLGWLGRRETKRSEAHLAELAHMSTILAERNRRETQRFWERADKRWADHEALMRMIFDRVDRGNASGG